MSGNNSVPLINPDILNIDKCEKKDVIDTATRQAMAMLLFMTRVNSVTRGNFAEVCARIALVEGVFPPVQWVVDGDERIAVFHTPEMVEYFIGATVPVDPMPLKKWLIWVWDMHMDNILNVIRGNIRDNLLRGVKTND